LLSAIRADQDTHCEGIEVCHDDLPTAQAARIALHHDRPIGALLGYGALSNDSASIPFLGQKRIGVDPVLLRFAPDAPALGLDSGVKVATRAVFPPPSGPKPPPRGFVHASRPPSGIIESCVLE